MYIYVYNIIKANFVKKKQKKHDWSMLFVYSLSSIILPSVIFESLFTAWKTKYKKTKKQKKHRS